MIEIKNVLIDEVLQDFVVDLTVDKTVFDIACLFYRSGVETPVVLFFCNY